MSLAHIVRSSPGSPKYPKAVLARTLAISRGSFYLESKIDKKDKALAVEIERYHQEVDDTLGHKKLAILLKTGKNRVLRVMKKYGISPRRTIRRNIQTRSRTEKEIYYPTRVYAGSTEVDHVLER